MNPEEISTMTKLRNDGLTWQEIADILGRSLYSVKSHARKHGLTGTHRPYTEDQDEWIKANIDGYSNYDEMAEDFNRVFDSNKTGRGLQSHAVRYLKIISGRQWFSKGKIPHNRAEIGSEYTNNANGYTYVKVTNDKDRNIAWQSKQRVVYEKKYGKIPEGHNVIFLDGDKTNFAINNLECISDKTNRILQSRNWHFGSQELTRAAIKVVELENEVKRQKEDEKHE